MYLFFFFNAPATTEIYTLSLHDALPILETFSGEVLKQNTKHNLTGAKTKKDFEFHIEDCVKATIQASDKLENIVVDYGSGSGLLGVVIKILKPIPAKLKKDEVLEKIESVIEEETNKII